MYSPQEPESNPYSPGNYPPPPPTETPYPYPPQGAYPPQTGPYPYPPQGAYPPPPGTAPYPYPPAQPGMAPYPYPPQGSYMPPAQKIQNRRANRAMIYGFISIALALITLLQEVGAAGIITGTFAIIYGFTSLKVAKQLPGNAGRAQAITGIVLGFVAWFLVIISLVIRSSLSGS